MICRHCCQLQVTRDLPILTPYKIWAVAEGGAATGQWKVGSPSDCRPIWISWTVSTAANLLYYGDSVVTDVNGPDFSRGTQGCLPAVAQDAKTGQVLMLAYMNQEAFDLTVSSGRAVYYSRSRQRLWHKGEESGHVQVVQQILIDCDADAIVLRVDQEGAACHKGYRSCFFRELTSEGPQVIAERHVDPKDVYKNPKK